MTQESLLDLKLSQLEAITSTRKTVQHQLDGLKAQEAMLRFDIQAALQTMGFDSVRATRATVSVIRKPKFELRDPSAVFHWLSSNKLDIDAYRVLDTAKAKQLAEQSYIQNGEIISGYEVTQVESLRITPRKDTGNKTKEEV